MVESGLEVLESKTDDFTGTLELGVNFYVPHRLVGVMAQNTKEASGEKHVWSVGEQKI